jgi:ribosomal protein S18 acetylase RimI-like enzyme
MPRTWLATHADVDDVARLLIAFRDHWGASRPSDNAFLAGVERLMDDRDTDFLLGAVGDDAPAVAVAQMRFRFGIWRAGTECLLEDLFVQEDARRQGLGQAMMDAVLVRAMERGARQLELDVFEGNAAAIALYEGYGLRLVQPGESGRRLLMRVRVEEPAG